MTAEVSGLLLFGWQVSGSPVRPRRPGRGRPWRGHGSGRSGVVSSTSTSGSQARSGPATPEAATARRVLEILGEASRVRRRGDEDWTHCQELITWAGKLALGRLKPTLTMPDEVWEFHRNESGGTSRWLEI
jgi:hypothetical protein